MFSFIEKFQSKDDEEEDNSSWLYPLLYALLAIFITMFFGFIGFIGYWMYIKNGQLINNNSRLHELITRTKIQPLTLGEKPKSLNLHNYHTPSFTGGKYKRKNISIKRRR